MSLKLNIIHGNFKEEDNNTSSAAPVRHFLEASADAIQQSENSRKSDEGKRRRHSFKSSLTDTRRTLNRAAVKERKLDTRQNRSGEYGGAPKKSNEHEVTTNLDDEEDELLLTYRGWDWDPKNA